MAQDYDVTLKLLRDPFERAIHAATGLSLTRWLDAELPQIQNPRMDLLGEASDGSRMGTKMDGPSFSFSYELIDLRNLDGEALLRSAHLGDNIWRS